MSDQHPWPADKIERRHIDKIIPNPRNPRTHDEAQIAAIAASIAEWKWTMPVLVDEKGMLIAGHGRILAARKLGITEVPVMVAEGWTEAQKHAYVIADNRLTDRGGWDNEMLKLELQDLKVMDPDFDLKLTGFTDFEINSFFGDEVENPLKAWDGMPEYEHEDQESAHKIIVHFRCIEDFEDFIKLIGQSKINEKTKSIWYPEMERAEFADKRYVSAGDDDPEDEYDDDAA